MSDLNLDGSGRKTGKAIVISLESTLLEAGSALLSRHGIAFCGAGTTVSADGELMLQVMTDVHAKVPDIYLPKWVDPQLGRVLQTGIDQFWERKGDVELVWAGERAPVKMGIIRIPKGDMVGQRVLMGISWALVTWQASQASQKLEEAAGTPPPEPVAPAMGLVAEPAAPAGTPSVPPNLPGWKSFLASRITTNSLLLAILLFLLLTLGAQLGKAQQSAIPARLIDSANNAMRVVCISGCAGGGGGGGGVIVDGVNNTIQATVLDYANSNPIAVRLTDTSGNYVGAGAGTQYATGAAQATPTGTLSLGYDGTNLRALLASAAGRLSVDVNSLVAIPTGSNTIGGVNLAQYTPVSGRLPVDGSGVTQPVSGTITANLGTIADVATQTTLSAINTKLPALSGGRVPVEATGSGKFDIFPTSPVATTYISVRLTDGTSFYNASGGGGGGDGAILDGVSSGIKATVFDYTNSNPISVRLTDTNGDYVGAGAGTQYATGTAVGTPTGTAALGYDGANVRALLTSAAGRLSVDVNSLVAIPTGSNTIGAVNLAQYTPVSGRLPVDGSGVTQPVSGTITANIGTSGALALDASVTGLQVSQGSTTSGQKGELMMGAVTTGAPSYTTAQTSPLSLTTAGALRVDNSAVTQPISAASLPLPSGAATSAKQPALGTAGSASADVISVQGIASMTPLVMSLNQVNGVTLLTGNGTTGTGSPRVTIANDNSPLAVSQSGAWTVQPGNTANTTAWLMQEVAGTANGCTLTSAISAASTNATSTKASAGQLYWGFVSNTNASARYLKIYNKSSSPTVGTDTPVLRFIIPPSSSGWTFAIPTGAVFSTGIAWALTTGATDADTGAVAANELLVNLCYK